MKKELTPRGWIVAFVAGLLALALLLSAVMYAVDPFFQFRVRNRTYTFEPRFVNGGLIKNYDYDFLMVGSSLTQNFHMDVFREEMGVNPLHVSLSGIKPHELAELINMAARVGKAEHIMAVGPLGTLADSYPESKNPWYLLDSGLIPFLRYAFSYEAWFRYIPANIRLAFQKMKNPQLSESLLRSMDVDYLGNWESRAVFGEEEILELYRSQQTHAGAENDASVYDEIIRGMDAFFESLDTGETRLSFFLPPYSAVFWHCLGDLRETYLDARDHFVVKAAEYGYTVYDFQGEDYICDLNNYMDFTHYSGEINDRMTVCFAKGENIITPDNMAEYRAKLVGQIERISQLYPELA